MPNTDYLEVRGPQSLTELLTVVDPSASSPASDVVTISLGADEFATLQYDAVDAETWPYMITVDSRTEDEAPVRDQSTRLFKLLGQRGWKVRLTSDSDDDLELLTTLSTKGGGR